SLYVSLFLLFLCTFPECPCSLLRNPCGTKDTKLFFYISVLYLSVYSSSSLLKKTQITIGYYNFALESIAYCYTVSSLFFSYIQIHLFITSFQKLCEIGVFFAEIAA